MKKNILIVPGFLSDTYSAIERSFVEFSGWCKDDLEITWLVPSMGFKESRFESRANRELLSEQIYVAELKKKNIPIIEGNIYRV